MQFGYIAKYKISLLKTGLLMKPLQMNNNTSSSSSGQNCCAPPQNQLKLSPNLEARLQAVNSVAEIISEKPSWVTGVINTPSGLVPVVTAVWSREDHWGQIRSRLGAYRMEYTVKPGLYAIGTPDAVSDIFVSANYKLSYDILRRNLSGINGWILVLDTKGINVWCAAGKGTFGTEELINRVLASKLSGLVTHRRIIVPQLGATGVKASEVKKKTGFTVYFGPVEASNIKGYVDARYHATPEMRKIRFNLAQRLVLVPIELTQGFRYVPITALMILIIFGIQPSGILFYNAWFEGWPFIVLSVVTLLAGGLVTPALLPFIPFRSFALKGLFAGAAVIAPLVLLTPLGGSSMFYRASALTLFPLLSSYLALQFTGATTFTTISGVKKELKIWIPIYIAGLVISVIMLVLYKLQSWGLV